MVPDNINLQLPAISDLDLSIIIVSYNTRELTMACVRSVLEQKGPLTVEIIVVDNCSSDGSASALRAAFPEITVIDSPTNGGFAYGNNIGFEQSSGRYFLLLNPDTEVYADVLEGGIAFMDSLPDIGVMGSKILHSDGVQQSSMIRYLSLTQLFFIVFIPSLWLRKTRWFGDLRYAALSRETVNIVDAVSGCFMLVRRSVLDQVGGLDERFFMYGEEAEWCHRITRAGWKVAYNPDVQILHHGAASTAHMSQWKAIEMTRGHILFLRFTRGALVSWVAIFLMTLRDLLRIPFYIVQTIVRGFNPHPNVAPWWARLKFLLRTLFVQPKGQSIARPDPGTVQK